MSDTRRGEAGGQGRLLWTPSGARIAGSRLTEFNAWLEARHGLVFADYAALWRWSVSDIEAFWGAVWEYFDVASDGPAEVVLAERVMPGARWFPDARLNYAEHMLRGAGDSLAVIAVDEAGARAELSRSELASRVARAAHGLRKLGVERGDRVVGYLPNAPEALVAMLAVVSMGAIWSSCPPEFGVDSVLDRFTQIEPKVMFYVDVAPYGGKAHSRLAEAAAIARGLPSLEATVLVRRGTEAPIGPNPLTFDELVSEPGPLEFERVPFDHPLYILYSSGTTGLPKPIVHGHGGILLEHLKVLALHGDLRAEDRFFWFSTTGWMMWNYLVSGLLLGATVVLYEGSPGYPDLSALFRMASAERVTYFGTSAPFIMACRKAGLDPARELDLAALRAVGSTGAPLPVEGFEWVYEHLKADVWLSSVSGGTDLCTAFVAGSPTLPVYAGMLQANALGAKVESYGPDGHAHLGQVGELVISAPMPSMPVSFWSDPTGERYRSSYFGVYPGVWRHGDFILIDDQGRSVISGRSDATLNRGGVRMGTSEIYRVVEAVDGVVDSVVVDTERLGVEGKLWLFVVLDASVTDEVAAFDAIRSALRVKVSPRHVPDELRRVPGVPRTLSGKKLEVPIKRLLHGEPMEAVINLGTLANPETVQALLDAVGQ